MAKITGEFHPGLKLVRAEFQADPFGLVRQTMMTVKVKRQTEFKLRVWLAVGLLKLVALLISCGVAFEGDEGGSHCSE